MRTRITCCKNGMLRDEEVRAIEMDADCILLAKASTAFTTAIPR